MGNNISIGDSLIITLFSMAIVFVVLVAISYLIEVLRVATNGKKDDKKPNKTNIVEEKQITKKEELVEENLNDEELVAVIAAAVAASLGVSIPEVKINSIKRTSSTTTPWAEMGRREQILGKL